MRRESASPLIQATTISEAFLELACAANGDDPPDVRTFVVDELVLTVTEHEHARSARHCDGPSAEAAVEIGDPRALQRRKTVEEVTGRHVTATLSGRRTDPDVNFELFILAPRVNGGWDPARHLDG